jgi:UDP-N-acetylglucosamine:LPS N-acetylglucosamine transferase
VANAGFSNASALPGRGIQRRLTVANVASAWGLVRAVAQAIVLVRRRRPTVVLAVGGYASVACALAAAVWRVPLVVAEQNARAGLANRVTSRFARACAVSFPGTDLPRTVVTGNPVRAEILAAAQSGDVAAARRALGLPTDRRVVAVFSGSLGSRRINDAAVQAVDVWSDRPDLAVRHVVGRRDWTAFVPPVGDDWALVYQPVEYEDRMDLLLAAADLAVCRAGGSVAELTVMGLPSILVPLPIAPRDHQRANAEVLAEHGAAVVVADAELDGARLVAEADAILTDGERLESMRAAARRLARGGAADAVAELLEVYGRG